MRWWSRYYERRLMDRTNLAYQRAMARRDELWVIPSWLAAWRWRQWTERHGVPQTPRRAT